MSINFISSKDNCEEFLMHWKSDNIEIMINDKPDEVTEKLFKSLLNRYQVGLETSIRGSDFIFDCTYLLHYQKMPKNKIQIKWIICRFF